MFSRSLRVNVWPFCDQFPQRSSCVAERRPDSGKDAFEITLLKQLGPILISRLLHQVARPTIYRAVYPNKKLGPWDPRNRYLRDVTSEPDANACDEEPYPSRVVSIFSAVWVLVKGGVAGKTYKHEHILS